MDKRIISDQDTVWKSPTKYFVAALIILFGIFILYISRGIVTLLLTSALLAFIASPLIKFFHEEFKLPRGLSVAITYLLAGLFLLIVPIAFLSQGTKALNFFLGLNYLEVAQDFLKWLETFLNSIKVLNFPIVDPIVDNAINSMLQALQNIQKPNSTLPQTPEIDTVLQSLINAFTVGYDIVAGIVGGVISGVLAFVFLIMTSIYFSIDGENFLHTLLEKLPPAYQPEFSSLAARIRNVWEGFFRGQVTLMLTIGSIIWIGGSLIGLPFALVLGVISGLLEILPNLGPTLATLPAVIIALILGPTNYEMNHLLFALIVISFYVLVQFFENSLLVPKIMGGALDLHPILVITGVFVGATVWGILGALIAAPMIATFKEIFGYIFYKLAWEEPKSNYQAPPEEAPGILQVVNKYLQRFRRKKPTSQSISEEIISPSTLSENVLINKEYSTPTDTTLDTGKDSKILHPEVKYAPPLYNQDHEIVKKNPRTYSNRERSGSTAFVLLSIAGVFSSILFYIESKKTGKE